VSLISLARLLPFLGAPPGRARWLTAYESLCEEHYSFCSFYARYVSLLRLRGHYRSFVCIYIYLLYLQCRGRSLIYILSGVIMCARFQITEPKLLACGVPIWSYIMSTYGMASKIILPVEYLITTGTCVAANGRRTERRK